MPNVVKFNAHNKEYQLTVIDKDGKRWITAQQLGEALGNKNIRKLVAGLIDSGEIIKDKHYCNLTLQNSGPGNPNKTVLSYRGVIRIAMSSHGSRAREFRNWAEEVLFNVMMTGQYCEPEAVQKAFENGVQVSFELADALRRANISMSGLMDLLSLRRMGFTQRQTAGALGITRDKEQLIEKHLKAFGVKFDPVFKKYNEAEARKALPQTLFGPGRGICAGGDPCLIK